MEAQIVEEKVTENATRKCFSCGNQVTGKYCPECGSKIEFLGYERASSLQNLKNILKEYLQQVFDPIFAYIKTIYLLLIRPVDFFEVLCFRDKPINDIPFPLSGLWKRVSSDKATQYTLHPIAFFTSNFVINIISGALALVAFLLLSRESNYSSNNLPTIPALSSAGLSTLLYMLASAFIFDILTKESRISPQFKYSFWVYMFSLVWAGWLVVLCVLIFMLPVMLIIGCVLACCITLIILVATQNSESAASIFPTMLSGFSQFSGYFSTLIACIGGVYIFWVIPRRVFKNVFQRENLPTNNLWIIILASLIIPAIPLSICAFPLILPR